VSDGRAPDVPAFLPVAGGHPALEAELPVGSEPRPNRRRPLLVGELAGVLFLLFGYDRVAAFAGGRAAPAIAHGRHLLAAERSLHLAVEYRLDHALAEHPGLGQALSVYYDFAHGIVTFGVLGALYLCRPAGYRSARWVLVALNVAALGLFASFPVAPPRLLPAGGFTDIVATSGTWGSWESSASSVAQHANLYAAFPSLHVGQASWVLLVVVATTRRPWLRRLAGAHLALTVLIVLSTGNHYVIDVAGGGGLTALTWYAVHGWTTRRGQVPVADLAGAPVRLTG
jgi:diacylglycerol O-acyltransferase / wax synthase